MSKYYSSTKILNDVYSGDTLNVIEYASGTNVLNAVYSADDNALRVNVSGGGSGVAGSSGTSGSSGIDGVSVTGVTFEDNFYFDDNTLYTPDIIVDSLITNYTGDTSTYKPVISDVDGKLYSGVKSIDDILQSYQLHENGFENRIDSVMSFDNVTRTFTIEPTTDSFMYYQGFNKYDVSTPQSIQITDTEGLHFFYFSGGTLQTTLTFSDNLITDAALCSYIYWDLGEQERYAFGDERHGFIMDSSTHIYNHLTYGARYGNGLGIGGMDVDGDGDDNSSGQFLVNNGVIWDEDIETEITNGSPQILGPIAEIPMFYLEGTNGHMKRVPPTTYPITTTGTGRAAYNLNTNDVYSLVEVPNNDFVYTHYIATNSLEEPIIGIVGQNYYTTLNNARNNAENELKTLNFGLLSQLTPESVSIATVIWQTNNGYVNGVKSRVRSTEDGSDYIDWRVQRNNATGGASGIDGSSGSSGTSGSSGIDGVDGNLSGITYEDTLYFDDPVLYTPKIEITDTTISAITLTDVITSTKYNLYISSGVLTITQV